MLRVYKGDKKGATAFFRNREFLNTIISLLKAEGLAAPAVFFHACSIGAEPYSFAATAKASAFDVAIDATDIEPDFISHAQKAVYPADILGGMLDDEKQCFEVTGQGEIKLRDDLRASVNFVPAQSITAPLAKSYDAVFAMNVLTYLPPKLQTEAIATMAKSARKYLCVTAFHPDQIKADMEAAGFAPVLDTQAAIHNAWGDRVRPNGARAGTPEYSWVVPPYNTDAADYCWRYCAIFGRAAS
jgi:chemotaxis methyl-accepting protein methylase